MKRIFMIIGLIFLFIIASSFVTNAAQPVEADAVSYAEIDQSQNFFIYRNKYYWSGTLTNDDVYQENYFATYINQVIAPASSSSAEFSANIAAFVNQVKTTGIVVNIPSNLSIKLFVSSWFQSSIDPWYEINVPVSQVIIQMPDLVVEGIDFPYVGEAWGNRLIYVVDGTPYEFSQVNEEYGHTDPPRIGIQVLSDELYTVSFETRSDTVISDQTVISGGFAETPADPMREGFRFYGWTLSSHPSNEIIPPYTYLPKDFPSSEEIDGDTVFYAMWRRIEYKINLNLNGGTRIKNIARFTSDYFFVGHNLNAYQNSYEMDFDHIVERSGYELDGWYTNASLTIPFNPESPITSDITIHAKWRKVFTSVGTLPDTEGNPYMEGMTGTATFTYKDNDFEAEVIYDGLAYNIKLENVGFSSASFLSNVSSVSYYSIDGDKYLQFNYKGSPNVLLNSTGQITNNWSGFGLWNLTDNKVTITQRALVLTYLNMDKQTRDAFAYLYMPTVIMDDLMSVSVVFKYRYLYPFGVKGNWQDAARLLEAGVEDIGGVPQDVLDLYTVSGAALAAGVIIPVLRWPLLAAGGLLLNVANVKLLDHMLTGAINEIEPVSATATFRLELNEYYTRIAGRPINVGAAEQVYRLYLGKFSAVGSSDAEIDNSTYKYTEITWMTDGEIYSLTQPYLDQHSVINDEWVDRVENHGELNLPPWVKTLTMILVTVAFIWGAVFKSNFFRNWRVIIPIGAFYTISMILISIML